MENNLALRKFVEALAKDDNLRNKFKKIAEKKSIDKAYDFALNNSTEKFSKDEFRNYFFALSKAFAESNITSLKESSLGQISGGAIEKGVLPNSEEFWGATGSNSDGNGNIQADIIKGIYKNENELLDNQNKNGYIRKALETTGTFVEFIKTLGNLYLSKKDRDFADLEYKDRQDERRIHELQNLKKLKKLEDQLREKGIKY